MALKKTKVKKARYHAPKVPRPLSNKEKTLKRKIMKYWDEASTCGCGLYINPKSPMYNPKAIHITDCIFHPKRK